MTTFNSRKITVTLLVLFAGLCFWQALPANVSRDAASSLSPSVTAEVGPTSDRLKTIETQPIETIRVGQRVLAHNPEVDRSERLAWGPEPDFSQWLHLTLEMPKEDGSTLTIHMLRPDEWVDSQLSYVIDEAAQSSRHAPRDEAERDQTAEIENHRRDEPASQIPSSATSTITAKSSVDQSGNTAMPHHAERDGYVVDAPLSPLRPVFRDILFTSLAAEEAGVELIGMTVQMDLPEMGAVGTAIITDIQPAPQIDPADANDRQVVTATFRHPPSTTVLDVTFADHVDPTATGLNPETRNPKPVGSDSLGVTDNHLFWSVDRQEFVPIGEMEIGERVQTYHGETKRIASKLPRPGPPKEVYNLEVYGEHVYFVGEEWLLAHNSCMPGSREHRNLRWAEYQAAAARGENANYGLRRWLRSYRTALKNGGSGSAFEIDALGALGATGVRKNIGGHIPDLPVGLRYGVTEIKNVEKLHLTPQLSSFGKYASKNALPFNLIISPRTHSISEPLLRRIRKTGGSVFQFDASSRAFSTLDIGDVGRWTR